MEFKHQAIGVIRTPFREKFGVPRQSMMMSEARGVLKLKPDPTFRVALNHLDEFTHLWVVFVFHQVAENDWRPTIRPPRVDAPRKVGVFASRSPHRPNPIGISAVKLERIDLEAPGGIEIHLSGVDLLDGTPVLDIKPYLPYADIIPEAASGWAGSEIPRFEVRFSDSCSDFFQGRGSFDVDADLAGRTPEDLRRLIVQTLEWDPRPTSQRRAMPIGAAPSEGLAFGFRILNIEVKWEIRHGGIFVTELEMAANPVS
jgi:tRNA-Thr(GGU) m(6)t(6)A37 methyltransferase TsaA